MKLSVVIPCYGCPTALVPLCKRLTDTVTKITDDYEIILVNDADPLGSWSVIQEICAEDSHVVGINLSRNFGQMTATNAGLEHSTGDYVVTLDCDLQDRPECITDLYEKMQEGYDIVFLGRLDRKDNPIVKFLASSFYKVYNHFVDGFFDYRIASYCMVSRQVVDEYCSLPEHHKTYTAILSWMGYRQATIYAEGDPRFAGTSSYNFKRKLVLATEMITFQSNKPLLFFMKFGFAIALFAFLFIIFQLVDYFVVGDDPNGWMTLFAMISLLGGVQLISLGVIGIYIGNIFNETKHRKTYFVQEILNDNMDK